MGEPWTLLIVRDAFYGVRRFDDFQENLKNLIQTKLEGGLTRGPNGISDVDPMNFFGWHVTSLDEYLWLALGTFAVVIGALYLVNASRTGRAWRALREDPLAAELMSMPVNRLKLVAFAFGAAFLPRCAGSWPLSDRRRGREDACPPAAAGMGVSDRPTDGGVLHRPPVAAANFLNDGCLNCQPS